MEINEQENKKEFDDLGDTFQFIYDYLDNKSLYELNLVNKYQKKNIEKKPKCTEKIFKYKIQKIPIYQSYLHKMGDFKSKPKYYKWIKNDFTIYEKALINIYLLDCCKDTDLPKYNQERKIFSLNKDGLIYQLPSYSGVIKPDRSKSKNDDKEYVFIRVYELNEEYSYNNSYGYFMMGYEYDPTLNYINNLMENNELKEGFEISEVQNIKKEEKDKIVKKYKKIYFIDGDDFNELLMNEFPDGVKEVLNKMIEIYNEYNEKEWIRYKTELLNPSQILYNYKNYHF